MIKLFEVIATAFILMLAFTQPSWAIAAVAGKAFTWFMGQSLLVKGLIVVAAIYGVSKLSKMLRNKQGKQNRELIVNKQSNNDPIPVLYGQKRIGGVRAYISTNAGGPAAKGPKEVLNIALTQCEGITGQLLRVCFNDTVVWKHTSIGGNGTYEPGGSDVAGYELRNFETPPDPNPDEIPNFGSKTSINYHPGHPDQTHDVMLESSDTKWTTNHRLRGISYLAIQCQYDQKIFEGGVPTITAEFAGKKIQDVSAITSGDTTRTFVDPTYTYDSGSDTNDAGQNPVDVLYDYLVDRVYGKGLDYDPGHDNGDGTYGSYKAGYDIDLHSFQESRSYIDNSGNPKYKINGHLETDAKLYENINELLDSFNGMLIFINGQYRLRVRRNDETAITNMTFDENNIIGPISVGLQDINRRLNKIQSSYKNKDLSPEDGSGYEGYNDDTLVVPVNTSAGSFVVGQKYDITEVGDTDFTAIGAASNTVGVRFTATGAGSGTGIAVNVTYLDQDNDRVLERRVDNNLITDSSMLETLMQHKLDDSRFGTTISFDTAFTAMQVEAGDIIAVTHPVLEFDAKPFRVLQLAVDNEGTVNITAVEYESSIEI